MSNRNQYKKEYEELLVRRKTLAFKAMGFLQSLVKMNEQTFGPATKKYMNQIVHEYNKIDQEVDHIGSLLDLMDNDANTDYGEW